MGTDGSESGGADFIFIPERPPLGDPWEDEMCTAIQRVRVIINTTLLSNI